MKAIQINAVVNLTNGLQIPSGSICVISEGLAQVFNEKDGLIPAQIVSNVYTSKNYYELGYAPIDGNSIAGLLLNFFNKYWPNLFDRNMIFKVETPIVVAINKKNKKKLLFYNQSEYNEWSSIEDLKSWKIKYKKGLAALVDDEYQEIINNPNLTKITKDELSDQHLDIWFGKNSELRKNQILG